MCLFYIIFIYFTPLFPVNIYNVYNKVANFVNKPRIPRINNPPQKNIKVKALYFIIMSVTLDRHIKTKCLIAHILERLSIDLIYMSLSFILVTFIAYPESLRYGFAL